MNPREKLKALDEERSKVLEEAKAAALQKAQDAIRELGELGFHYSLIASPAPAVKEETGRSRAEVVKPPLQKHDQTLPGS